MAQIGTIARFEVSGEILNEDVLALLAARDAGVPGADMDKTEEGDFYAAWDLLRDQWQAIRSEVAEFDTERLRRRWIMPMLEMLGHSPQFLKSHPTLPSGASVPITHRTDTIPIWLADFTEKPDDRPTEGKRRRSKHELFQEYLDMTEDDWGILCTGQKIRLLTDYHKTLTRNFVEADLESIFDELDLDAFRIVWRLFRASAYVPKAKGVRDIERIRDHARQQGTEIGKELRKQVVEAVVTLANGFLEADETGELRQAVESDSEGPMRLYQSVLRVVYRLLFLLYVENKPGWTPAQDPRWASGYSISRLRAMAEDPGSFRAEGEDLWEGLKVTFRIIREGCTLFNEPISPYGGELFDDERLWLLKDPPLANAPLLRALYLLTIFERREKKVSTLHRVNFRNLQIDALGSVYESLLEERPILDPEGRFGFFHRAGKGNKRKETGSYYTPPELVAELIKTALLPVIADRLEGKTTQAEQREAILGISVVDPACGSGAFLIQALDALAEALLKVQLGDEQPSELQLREARRDVAIHCIHGVDMNPMAVELCKFTLWLHVAHPKFPLSYLEPLIRSGNSLVGVPTKAQIVEAKRVIAEERQTLLQQGKANDAKKAVYVGWEGFDLEPSKLTKVPDEAFGAVGDDDKDFAKSVQERNKSERAGQLRLTEGQAENFTEGRLAVYRHMQEIKEDDPDSIREKSRRFDQYLKSGAYRLPKRFADAWCAAFFWPLKDGLPEPPTQFEVAKLHPAKQRAAEVTPVNAELVAEIERRAEALQFFHWELEYPDVFAKGGFDVVLGNPPWDQVQIDAREFFAGIRNDIAEARTNIRNDLIEKLRTTNPELYERYAITQHGSDGFKKFVHFSGLYPLTEHGRINVAPLFAELNFSMHRDSGRAGFILPSGIATDSFKQKFFAWLVASESLSSFFDFENKNQLFNIHRSFKFALMTLARGCAPKSELRFFLHNPEEIDDPARRIELDPAEFRLLNPNTRTSPILRTRQDADLLRFLYERVPILVNERTGANPWGIRYQLMFMMNTDSKLFKTREELEAMGARLDGDLWVVD